MRAFLPRLALAYLVALPAAWAGEEAPQCAAEAHRCPAAPVPVFTTSINYPICFYDTDLGAVTSAKKAWPEYSKNLANAITMVTHRNNSVVVVNSRNVVVRTTRFRHRQLEKMWARIGCMGQSGSATADTSRKRCEQFMNEVVVQKKEPLAAPSCQTFLD